MMDDLRLVIERMALIGFKWIADKSSGQYHVVFREMNKPREDAFTQSAKSDNLLLATSEAAEKVVERRKNGSI
jgi:hypothetical protein